MRLLITAGFATLSLLSAQAQTDNLWVAGNQSIEIAVNKATGTVERLLDKTSGEDYCNQVVSGVIAGREFDVGRRVVGLSILDELRKQEYSDLKQTPKIAGWKATATGLTFEKSFAGADFVVHETYTVHPDHVRWDVRIRKKAGRDRTLRVIQHVPMPLGSSYRGWAPIADSPFDTKPYTPFVMEYGQSTSGAVGEARWRTVIPMVVFHSEQKNRALSITHPFEVPAVRIRFMKNTGAHADFHWNSRHYPPEERPYLQVVNEYLGLRDKKDVETSLLIGSHPADWRPALGWVYEKYREYFDADPNFDPWDGNYVIGHGPMKDSYTEADLKKIFVGRRERGVLWEEMHGHFPWYGLMIPKPDVKSWECDSHPQADHTNTRERIAAYAKLSRDHGIGTFIYYNITEAEHWYGAKEFPESVAKDEDGKPIGAFRAAEYPGRRACWLMNADPASPFGKHMIQQARELVETYPALAGFFWDVYGRSYMFDFAHDDGITMVNNKPAYFPGFMYERMMKDHVGPLLRGKGMTITANKPTMITHCKGLDGIMALEDTPEEGEPPWIVAQSYLGLNRHVMILDGLSGTRAEVLMLHCLTYGFFHSDLGTRGAKGQPLPPEKIEANARLAKAYLPFLQRFRGKKWVFHPRALELPLNTEGNIFRLKDGAVLISLTSVWRSLRNVSGFDTDLKVVCRLPDAASLNHVYASSIDLGETRKLTPEQQGDTLTLTVPRHAKGTAILLAARPDAALEGAISAR